MLIKDFLFCCEVSDVNRLMFASGMRDVVLFEDLSGYSHIMKRFLDEMRLLRSPHEVEKRMRIFRDETSHWYPRIRRLIVQHRYGGSDEVSFTDARAEWLLKSWRTIDDIRFPGQFWLLPSEVITDSECIRHATRKFGSMLLQVAPSWAISNPGIVESSLIQDPSGVPYVSEALWFDVRLLERLINHRKEAVCHLFELCDRQKIAHLRDALCRLLVDKVKQCGDLLRYVPDQHKTIEMVAAAVGQCGSALEYVPESMKSLEVARIAIRQNGEALAYLSAELQEQLFAEAPEEVVEALHHEMKMVLPAISHKILTKKLLIRLFDDGVCTWLFGSLPDELKHDPEIISRAVRLNGELLDEVPQRMKTDEIIDTAVQQNGEALQYVPEFRRTATVVKTAIRCNFAAISFVPRSFFQNEDFLSLVTDLLQHQKGADPEADISLKSFVHTIVDILNSGADTGLIADWIRDHISLIGKYALEIFPSNLWSMQMLDAVLRYDPALLRCVPPWLYQDSRFIAYCLEKKLFDQAVQYDGHLLRYVPRSLMTANLILSAVRNCGMALQYVPEEFRSLEVVRAALGHDGLALEFVKDPSIELIRVAMKSTGRAFCYISSSLLEQMSPEITKEVWVRAVLEIPSLFPSCSILQDDFEVAMEVVRRDGTLFQFVSDRLKQNRSLALVAVQKNPDTFLDLPRNLRNDEEIVLWAVAGNGMLLEKAGSAPRRNRHVVMVAVSQAPKMLFAAHLKFQSDDEIVMRALRGDPTIFRLLSATYRSNLEYARIAIRHDPNLLQYAENSLPECEEMMHLALRAMPMDLPLTYDSSDTFKKIILHQYSVVVPEYRLQNFLVSRLYHMLQALPRCSELEKIYMLEELGVEKLKEFLRGISLSVVPLEVLVRMGQTLGLKEYILWLRLPGKDGIALVNTLSEEKKEEIGARFQSLELNEVLGLPLWDEASLTALTDLSNVPATSLVALLRSMPISIAIYWLQRTADGKKGIRDLISKEQRLLLDAKIDQQILRTVLRLPSTAPSSQETVAWNTAAASSCDTADLHSLLHYMQEVYSNDGLAFVLLKLFENAQLHVNCNGDCHIYWMNEPKRCCAKDSGAIIEVVNGIQQTSYESDWIHDGSIAVPALSLYREIHLLRREQPQQYLAFSEMLMNRAYDRLERTSERFVVLLYELLRIGIEIEQIETLSRRTSVSSLPCRGEARREDSVSIAIADTFSRVRSDLERSEINTIKDLLSYIRFDTEELVRKLFPKDEAQRSLVAAQLTLLFLFALGSEEQRRGGSLIEFGGWRSFFRSLGSSNQSSTSGKLVPRAIFSPLSIQGDDQDIQLACRLIRSFCEMSMDDFVDLCRAWADITWDPDSEVYDMPQRQIETWLTYLDPRLRAHFPERTPQYLGSLYVSYHHVLRESGVYPSRRYPISNNALQFCRQVPPLFRHLGSLGSALAATGWTIEDPLYHEGDCGVASFLFGLYGRDDVRSWEVQRWASEIARFRSDIAVYARDHRQDVLNSIQDHAEVDEIIAHYAHDGYSSEVVFQIAALRYDISVSIFAFIDNGFFTTDGQGHVIPTYQYGFVEDGAAGRRQVALVHRDVSWYPIFH